MNAAVDRSHVDALFDEALDRSLARAPGDWRAWLAEACDDAAVRAEVDALLEAHRRASGVLDTGPLRPAPWPPANAARPRPSFASSRPGVPGGVPNGVPNAQPHTPPAPNEPSDVVGAQVGPYRLVRELGRGGMGTVFLAERVDDHFAHTVAVKILRRGLDTDDVVWRFVAERQILATLQHPNIARLLDGGVTGDGRPYYVMEYVDGEPIDAYCDARRLSVPARLRLFRDVACAVQAAHRSLVVHRDLKPSNVLVTTDGQVKLLDFGIAKLLDPEASPLAVPLTRTGLRLMTPEYASPEQVLGAPVTTATDVYGLGLILYELLTGRRAHRPADRSLRAVERAVCEVEPPRPSAAVGQSAELPLFGGTRRVDASAAAAARATTPTRLRRALAGDLDRIVAHALRKRPERRYASAEQLARDIERFLAGRPVSARGDSPAYRAHKFVLRHRWSMVAAAAFVVLLAGYAGTLTVQARGNARAFARAVHEADKAEQATALAMTLFEAGARADAARRPLTVRELLAEAAARAERLAGEPTSQAQLLDVIGRAYQRVGDYAAARPAFERALELRRGVFGEAHETTAESMARLAALHSARGHYAPAETLYRDALAVQRTRLGGEHPHVARTLDALGLLLQDRGDFAGAERLTREALAVRRKAYGRRHADVAASMSNLAVQLQLQGRHGDAEPLFREALAIRGRLYGPEHPDVAAAESHLALLMSQRGQLTPAESLFRVSLAKRRRLLGPDHPDVSRGLGLLAAHLRRSGRLAEAERSYRESVALGRRVLGEEHPDVAHSVNGLGLTLRDRGDLRGADSLFRRVLDVRRRVLGPRHPAVATSLGQLGGLARTRGDLGAAEPLLLQSFAIRRHALGDSHPQTRESARDLALLYDAAGRPAVATRYRVLFNAGG